MQEALRQRCEALMEELNLVEGRAILAMEPLTGGVASDIVMLDLDGEKVCAKFALPKLKVAEDWRAPVHRNAAEYAWLKVAAEVAPESAVRVFGRSEKLHGFAMEFLTGDDVVLWKSDLLAGREDVDKARAVGSVLGRIHAASTKAGFDKTPFDNRDDFHALRLEPYLDFTATKYAQVSTNLTDLSRRLYESEAVLVHGDVSPKNIIFRNGQPILLDAECATMGAPEFDVAFCLNHLVLKAQHVPVLRSGLAEAVSAFWRAYTASVAWEPVAELERRVCGLLPALMLARVDGKSPVEYLDERSRAEIREKSLELLTGQLSSLAELINSLSRNWKDERS